jgi:pimeloyl-ACP methyl ester carboxylesterase
MTPTAVADEGTFTRVSVVAPAPVYCGGSNRAGRSLVSDSLRVPAPDGRTLEVRIDGPADGEPLLYHHGTPGSAVRFDALVDAAGRRGLRTIRYSRPGYGESTPQPGRSVADAAADVTAILDALGYGAFLTIGWSGGGPHALATATLLGDRCRAVTSVAGVAPYDAEGLDWLDGMGAENVEEFGAAARGDDAVTDFLERAVQGMDQLTGAQVADEFGSLASPVDVAALDGPMAAYIAAEFRHAVAQGISGWRDDDLAICRAWGFDPADVSVPVAVWQGRADRMVPYAHGAWLAARLPSPRVHLFDDEGHITLVREPGRLLDDLLEMTQGPLGASG